MQGTGRGQSSMGGSVVVMVVGLLQSLHNTALNSHGKSCCYILLKILNLCLSDEYNMVSQCGLHFHFLDC